MPDMDGFDLIRQVRSAGYDAQKLPAVALSAFAHKDDQRNAIAAGFQMHIAKPVEPGQLIAIICHIAGRAASGSENDHRMDSPD